jgi:hypothetical protein
MSLPPDQLRSVLECVHHGHGGGLWDAQDVTQLEWAAADGLTEVWAWSMPGPSPWGPEYSHARASLVAYVLGSTYRMRRAELREKGRRWIDDERGGVVG